MGFFVENTCNYVVLNKEGLSVLDLSDIDSKVIKNSDGKSVYLHSLHSANHLKIDKSNFIEFDFTEKVGFVKI